MEQEENKIIENDYVVTHFAQDLVDRLYLCVSSNKSCFLRYKFEGLNNDSNKSKKGN